MKKEFKSFKMEVKEISDEGGFDGYASTFGNIDFGGDIVDRGAFAKSIKTNGGVVPILDSHNSENQIGWNESAVEDSRGLKVHGLLDFNVQKAVERHSLMKTAKALGAKMGLSIGYRVIKAEPHKSKPEIRILKEVELMEYSVVTFPMNPKASVTRVKTIDGVDIDEVQKHLVSDMHISHKAASMACDMLRSVAIIEQGDIDHSMQEQSQKGYSSFKESLQKTLDIFKN
jgi:uncharacterized protein